MSLRSNKGCNELEDECDELNKFVVKGTKDSCCDNDVTVDEDSIKKRKKPGNFNFYAIGLFSLLLIPGVLTFGMQVYN